MIIIRNFTRLDRVLHGIVSGSVETGVQILDPHFDSFEIVITETLIGIGRFADDPPNARHKVRNSRSSVCEAWEIELTT